MIKIYSMDTCPDCETIKKQVSGMDGYEIIDIGKNVKDLKAFLKLRDSSPAFEEVKQTGSVGIPCFVLDDGTVTLIPEEAGLQSNAVAEGASCSLDGSGC